MNIGSTDEDGFLSRVQNKNKELIDIISRTKISTEYCYDSKKIMDDKVSFIAKNCETVLDFGKSSRAHFSLFKEGQAETADINQYEDYPDIICDICDPETLPQKTYDGIICNAVIEHVYNPFAAVKNMHSLLKKGGYCMCYAPFTFRYHAPPDLKFQDYFRFTRDGLALLFRDFEDVTLFTIRGKTSSACNYMTGNWKTYEKKMPWLNRTLDSLFGGLEDKVQVSGYVVWAKK